MPVERIYVEDRHVQVAWGQHGGSINFGTVKDAPDHENHAGQFLDLTERGHVNQLIRVLRKARDQAFGRDE